MVKIVNGIWLITFMFAYRNARKKNKEDLGNGGTKKGKKKIVNLISQCLS